MFGVAKFFLVQNTIGDAKKPRLVDFTSKGNKRAMAANQRSC